MQTQTRTENYVVDIMEMPHNRHFLKIKSIKEVIDKRRDPRYAMAPYIATDNQEQMPTASCLCLRCLECWTVCNIDADKLKPKTCPRCKTAFWDKPVRKPTSGRPRKIPRAIP